MDSMGLLALLFFANTRAISATRRVAAYRPVLRRLIVAALEMLSTLSTLGYAPTMAPAPTVARAAAPSMMDLGGLKEQAKQLNPVVGYFDPLGLGSKEFWGNTEEARPRRPRLGRRR